MLSAVGWQEQGQASGANNAMRELGGVFGIAVLAAIFANRGSYFTAETFMDGLTPAVWVGAVVVGIGAVVALLIPRTAGQAVAAAQGDWSQGAQARRRGVVGRARRRARRGRRVSLQGVKEAAAACRRLLEAPSESVTGPDHGLGITPS